MPVAAIAPPSPVNSAGESSSSSALSSSDTSSNGSDASDGAEGEGDGLDNGGVTEEGKLEYTSGKWSASGGLSEGNMISLCWWQVGVALLA